MSPIILKLAFPVISALATRQRLPERWALRTSQPSNTLGSTAPNRNGSPTGNDGNECYHALSPLQL